jgi:general stress protein YciG
MVAKIATGEIEDEREELTSAAAQLGRKGGKARAANMTPERRAEIARRAAEKRWKGRKDSSS